LQNGLRYRVARSPSLARRRAVKSDLREFAVMDRVIHEPAQLLIITLLYPVATMDFLRLRKVLGYTPGNLSSHLAKLETVGYLAPEKKFKGQYPMPICSLTKKGRAAIADSAEKMKSLLNATYDVIQNKP
jgi:DNA-binding MarR family transcriptional regulator